MKIRSLVTTMFAAGLMSSASIASTVPSDISTGPHLWEAANLVSGSATYTSNMDLEAIRIGADELWKLNGTDAPLIGLSNSFTNDLGWYDPNTAAVTLNGTPFSGVEFTGSGTALDPFTGTTFLGSALTVNPLGFALSSTRAAGTSTFFSQSGLNPDGLDHMVAYALGSLSVFVTHSGGSVLANYANAILIGWEDVLGGGDMDFNDGMFLIDATPVPLPASMWLLLGGLGGLAAIRRRNKVA